MNHISEHEIIFERAPWLGFYVTNAKPNADTSSHCSGSFHMKNNWALSLRIVGQTPSQTRLCSPCATLKTNTQATIFWCSEV